MESAGQTCSISPPPQDFAEVYVRTGWRGVRRKFGSDIARNREWLAQCGAEVRQQRIAWLRSSPKPGSDAPKVSRPSTWKPCPPAFKETFIRFGWRGIETAFGARNGVNLRWIEQSGGDALRKARLTYLARLRTLRADRARREVTSRRYARALHQAIPEGLPCL